MEIMLFPNAKEKWKWSSYWSQMIGFKIYTEKSTISKEEEGKRISENWINYTLQLLKIWCVVVWFWSIDRNSSLKLTIFHILGEWSWIDDQSQKQSDNWKILNSNTEFSKVMKKWITSSSESIDSHSVVLVLLVGISTPQTQTSQECTKEIRHETNNHQSSCTSNIAGGMCSSASRSSLSSKRQRSRSTSLDTLGEETFPPSFGLNPTGISKSAKE